MSENLGSPEQESIEAYLARVTTLHNRYMVPWTALLHRWAVDSTRGIVVLPTSDVEMAEHVADHLPSFVRVNKWASRGLELEYAMRRYKLDYPAEDILAAIAALLPRRLDAYHYRQNHAHDTLEVPGLGTIEVTLREMEGVLSTISEAKGPGWRLKNYRESGVKYIRRGWEDRSRLSEIEIEPLTFSAQLYGENYGSFAQDGKRYYVREAQNTWGKAQDSAVRWLAENVLHPLRNANKPSLQAIEKPEAAPFPFEKIGPLFSFMPRANYVAAQRFLRDPRQMYADEQYAIYPTRRLLGSSPLAEDISGEADNPFIYARQGVLSEGANLGAIGAIGHHLYSDFYDAFAQIKPQTAQDIFVVDWSQWRQCLGDLPLGHEPLTSEQLNQQHAAVARTVTPVTEYDGDFKDPVVIIGRELRYEEVVGVFMRY